MDSTVICPVDEHMAWKCSLKKINPKQLDLSEDDRLFLWERKNSYDKQFNELLSRIRYICELTKDLDDKKCALFLEKPFETDILNEASKFVFRARKHDFWNEVDTIHSQTRLKLYNSIKPSL